MKQVKSYYSPLNVGYSGLKKFKSQEAPQKINSLPSAIIRPTKTPAK